MMTKSHALENKYNAEDDVKKIQENEESKTSLEKLPTPTGWRLLVMPFKVKEETKGGIIIAQETLDRARVATQVGYVLKMGDLCYQDKEKFSTGPWCKEKDWVLIGRYAGARFRLEDNHEVRIINDDEVIGTIKFQGNVDQIYDIAILYNTSFPEVIEPDHPRMRNHFSHPGLPT